MPASAVTSISKTGITTHHAADMPTALRTLVISTKYGSLQGSLQYIGQTAAFCASTSTLPTMAPNVLGNNGWHNRPNHQRWHLATQRQLYAAGSAARRRWLPTGNWTRRATSHLSTGLATGPTPSDLCRWRSALVCDVAEFSLAGRAKSLSLRMCIPPRMTWPGRPHAGSSSAVQHRCPMGQRRG